MGSAPTFDTRVAQYVALRDKIKEIKAGHAEQLAPFTATLEKLGNTLLAHLNEVGGESVRTQSGTVYKTIKQSASIADGDAFMRHVIGTQSWDLIERRANVTAVVAFIEENDTLPPGVNFNSIPVVGVRRA